MSSVEAAERYPGRGAGGSTLMNQVWVVALKNFGRGGLALWFAIVAPALAAAQAIPSFPGADGAAANITGGRGGIVYHVTKLDRNFSDNVLGTLRYGLNDANFPAGTPRTVVFDVAGTFWLGRFGAERGHYDGWDTQSRINIGSNVTIAGQTAPGPVYIMGGVVKAGGNNMIVRNVTIAPGYGMRSFEKPDENPPELPEPGDFPDSYVFDAIDITGTNLMVDHVSTFYATDETISANELANNVTIQYSNISQGQNYPQADAEAGSTTYTGHALGSLLQAGSNAKISVHHNLYAHQKGRLPRVGSEVGTGAYNDFRNNVFYNWLSTAGTGASGQPSP
jgi:pectate lyase